MYSTSYLSISIQVGGRIAIARIVRCYYVPTASRYRGFVGRRRLVCRAPSTPSHCSKGACAVRTACIARAGAGVNVPTDSGVLHATTGLTEPRHTAHCTEVIEHPATPCAAPSYRSQDTLAREPGDMYICSTYSTYRCNMLCMYIHTCLTPHFISSDSETAARLSLLYKLTSTISFFRPPWAFSLQVATRAIFVPAARSFAIPPAATNWVWTGPWFAPGDLHSLLRLSLYVFFIVTSYSAALFSLGLS